MGRGNCCATGPYEGLYYIDNNDIYVYRRDDPWAGELDTRLLRDLDLSELDGDGWYLDEEGTMCEQDDIEECFMNEFTKRFPSFERVKSSQWLNRNRRVILENKLFYICVEDNQWSVAVELIQKEEPWGQSWMENLQARLYQKYLEGIKLCLLERLPGIGTYNGAWMSGWINREDVFRSDE